MVQLCYSNSRIKVWNNKIHLLSCIKPAPTVFYFARGLVMIIGNPPFPGHYHNTRRCVTVYNIYSKQEKIISASVFIDKTPAGTRPPPVSGGRAGGRWLGNYCWLWELRLSCEHESPVARCSDTNDTVMIHHHDTTHTGHNDGLHAESGGLSLSKLL